MELLKDDKKKSELLHWYFSRQNSRNTPEDSAAYAVNIFLRNNLDENGTSAHCILDEALLTYADEERALVFYYTKIFRLLADINSSVGIIQAFSPKCETKQEFNQKARALWREVSALLSNGVQLYWMYFPDLKKKKDRDFREYRARLLKSALCPPETFMQDLRSIRNVHVHFDEYLDEIYGRLVLNGKKVLDQAIAEIAEIDASQVEVARLYDPSTSILYHLGKESPSAPTELFMLNLQNLSIMAAGIFTTYQVNAAVPGWRFNIRLDMITSWDGGFG